MSERIQFLIGHYAMFGAWGFIVSACIAALIARRSGLPKDKKWLYLLIGAVFITIICMAIGFPVFGPFIGGVALGLFLRTTAGNDAPPSLITK